MHHPADAPPRRRAAGRPTRLVRLFPLLSHVLFRTVLAVAVGIALNACESRRSYERVAGGSTVYFDQLGDAEKAEARDKIAQILNEGLQTYDLQIGDEFEIFFDIARKPTPKEYVIAVADRLSIQFLNETDNNRVVQVRPDGQISMPLLGSITAAGKTIDALTRELQHRYASLLTQPQITINETETHSPLEDFIEAMGGASRARTVVDKVLPDGTISVPLLHPIKARGRTIAELESDIDAAYTEAGLGISVSLLPRSLRAGTALVLGEVARPGRIETDRPQTVLMTIAQAGGVLPTGSLEAIRVLYVGNDGLPRMRAINLKDVLEDLSLEEDMIVPNNAVIYVPPTELAKTGRLLDAVLRDILRFQGFSLGGQYLLNSPTSGGTVVVPVQ
ncbi:MAG: polysaccharide biosynthesis/export family protein [Alphaproteobacteria bacterium]|nr:polysaccharide biosynthesis/export family protein [Alphaproteobacteria bacterium]